MLKEIKLWTMQRNRFGDSYDFKALIEEFLRYTFNLNIVQPEDEKRFICSTFVNSAYVNAGIKLTDQYLPSPRDIMKSPFVAIVGYLIFLIEL